MLSDHKYSFYIDLYIELVSDIDFAPVAVDQVYGVNYLYRVFTEFFFTVTSNDWSRIMPWFAAVSPDVSTASTLNLLFLFFGFSRRWPHLPFVRRSRRSSAGGGGGGGGWGGAVRWPSWFFVVSQTWNDIGLRLKSRCRDFAIITSYRVLPSFADESPDATRDESSYRVLPGFFFGLKRTPFSGSIFCCRNRVSSFDIRLGLPSFFKISFRFNVLQTVPNVFFSRVRARARREREREGRQLAVGLRVH